MNSAFKVLIDDVEDYYNNIEDLKVLGPADPFQIRNHLSDRFDFSAPVPIENLINEVSKILRKWVIHTTHPRYFGLFNPTVSPASIIADTMAAAYNPNLAVWSHSPAAVEMERHVLRFLTGKFGMDPDSSIANFTSGGAEANHTAVITALTQAYPDYGDTGLAAIPDKPVIYVSKGAHDSFVKINHMTGLGRNALKKIDTSPNLKLDMEHLRKQVRDDRAAGLKPLFVAATAGTTGTGTIDLLEEIADFCSAEKMWYHVDAAWGGAAVLSREQKKHLKGIERADSVTCDAHKWFFVSMGAGMFFCRHPEAVSRAFRVSSTDYMPWSTSGIQEPYISGIQWSRRFIGLKVFMTLAEMGTEKFENILDDNARLGRLLKDKLIEKNWEIVNNTPLPVICFTHKKIRIGDTSTGKILEKMYERGRAWVSEIKLDGNARALRACITNFR
ncbi:pyridoxal phosphate-dependent decarboxylase family protein, partial [candidate division KSB1 bacterium]